MGKEDDPRNWAHGHETSSPPGDNENQQSGVNAVDVFIVLVDVRISMTPNTVFPLLRDKGG